MANAETSHDTSPHPANDPPFFVGIGSSAGGLEAVSTLAQNLSPDVNAVYVLAQHMSPTHKSLLTALISRETPLPVVELKDDTTPVANTIFITPPNTDVILEDGKLRLVDPSGHPASPKPSADRLFKSLAREAGEHCVGVVLSGTGSDGSYGVQAIREAGGITIAQDVTTAKYDGMPQSATETGCIDLTLSPEQIGVHLSKILASPRDFDQLRRLNERPSKMSDLFQILLARTNVDFRDYKENTVARRINRRMAALDIDDYDNYVAYCRTSGEEVEALYRDLLISVTRFFRDQNQFEQLRAEFQQMVEGKDLGQLRIWVAGCATGEEVYSIAIILAEAMGGIDRLKKSRVQIFATDIDDRALEVARRGSYPITAAADIPDQFLEKYFNVLDGRIEVVSELRAVTLFSMHNIFHDPPFLNVDFVSIRNVMIYFNTSLQNRVLHRIHYALNADGMLFLGTSETVGNMESLFEMRSGGDKIFSKRRISGGNPPRFEMGNAGYGRKAPPQQYSSRAETNANTNSNRQVLDTGMFDMLARSVAPNGFIVTRGGEMVRVFGDISHLTQLTENAPLWIGIRNLRKPLGDEIQGLIATAMKTKERRVGRWHDISGPDFNQARSVCFPLPGVDTGEDHLLVALETRTKDAQIAKVETLSGDEQQTYIRQMELEVAQTREALQQTVEELQTTNEELQSINEEMQSTNEELQATNEELETSNEELQSTNEELITVNEELQVNSAELQRVSTELAATLEVVPFPVLVIDQALIVRRASQAAMSQFNIGDLPATGFHLSQCRLPDEMSSLASICNEVFKFRAERSVVFNDGRTVKQLSVMPFRNQSDDVMGVVATVVDDISTGEAIDLLQRFGNIGHWQLDLTSMKMFWSDEIYTIHGMDPDDKMPSLEDAIGFYHPDDRAEVQRLVERCIETGEPYQFTLRLIRANGHTVVVEAAGSRILNAEGEPARLIGIFRNVTERTHKAHLMEQIEEIQSELGMAFYSYDLINDLPYWSSGLYTLLGYDTTDRPTSAKGMIDLFHHDDRERLQALWDNAIETSEPYSFEARLIGAEGKILECVGEGKAATDDNGVATHMFGRFQLTNS
ncbi:chemotaxis protein CheB [Jannaschia sp. CCS1]|uniref:chemotaxis protein CheB n=1 Tax=Jannaschia sp. (strain CCS1) TaxID=290400 RepID=UPI000053D054|nr:chemotaxis protein CheB [Jannaschia sp. CCS1]ABD55481.1 MCP methyltransferase/methylesterase, CheR/CheB with PAS/PAC sensor [Jannaschia sp. CCS1]